MFCGGTKILAASDSEIVTYLGRKESAVHDRDTDSNLGKCKCNLYQDDGSECFLGIVCYPCYHSITLTSSSTTIKITVLIENESNKK